MLSICIPSYQCDVNELLTTLQNQAIQFPERIIEILVVDDASNPPIAINDDLVSSVRLIRNPSNLGRSKTRNVLCREARGTHLLFIDCDSKIISDHFLKNWFAISDQLETAVAYGGSIYQDETPPSEQFLRWKISTSKESKTFEQRKLSAGAFKTNNVLIKRSLCEKIQFNEQLNGYGHEDTLFGFEILELGEYIHQIDNPVLNCVLDTNEVFLDKTQQAIENLVLCRSLVEDKVGFEQYVRILSIHKRISQFGMSSILVLGQKIFGKWLYNRLKTGNPFCLVAFFDLHKLMTLNQLLRKVD